MIDSSIKHAVMQQWRTALLLSASVTLTACVAGPSGSSSSEVAESSSSVAVSSAVSSSVAPASSSSVAPSSSSVAPSSSSVAPASSSSVAMSSSSADVCIDEPDTVQFDAGKIAFEAGSCVGCHGEPSNNGMTTGADQGPIDATKASYDGKTMAAYIASDMAFFLSAECKTNAVQCGEDIAHYLKVATGVEPTPTIACEEPSSSAASSSSTPVVSSSSSAAPAGPSLLTSSGTFTSGAENFSPYINDASYATASFSQEANFTINTLTSMAWHVQMTHPISVTAGEQYTICLDAKAASNRTIEVEVDNGPSDYAGISGGPVQFSLTTSYQSFESTFFADATDTTARLVINMGLDDADVQLDNIAVYAGDSCGGGSPTQSSSSQASSQPVASSSSSVAVSSSSSAGQSSSAPAPSGNLEEYFAANKCGVNFNAMGNGGWATCYRLEGGLAGCKTDMTGSAPTILKWANGENINNVAHVSGYQSNKAIVVTDDGAAYEGTIGGSFDQSSPIVSSGAIAVSGGFKPACILTKNGNTRDLVCNDNGWGRPSLPAGFDVMQVSVAYGYSCALNRQGEAWCWGSSPAFGSTISGTPSKLPFEEPLVNISTAQNGLCGTKLGGGLQCLYGRYDGPPYFPLRDGFESPVREPDNFHPNAVNVHMGYKLGVVIDNDGSATLYSTDDNSGTKLSVTNVVAAGGKRNVASNGDASGIVLLTAGGDTYTIAKGTVTQINGTLRAESAACNF